MRGSRKTIVSRPTPDQSCQMRQRAIPWPHAPTHQLSEVGTYFVTAGTYLKAHHFRTPERLDVLHRGVLSVARQFSWNLEAWAVFSNHYHFVARSPSNSDEATSLSQMLGALHTQTASWANRLDKTPGRKVWHNFWETKLYLSDVLSRPLELCTSESGKASVGARSKQIPVVFGAMV